MGEAGDDGGWRVIGSEIVLDTPHLRLRADDIELPGGERIGPYYVRESRGFAVVFAIAADGRAILVRQYKHGAGTRLLELPAGAIDPGESPEACAKRELAEETGFGGDDVVFEPAGTFYTDPTNSDARCFLFVARGVRAIGPQRLDATEDIVPVHATLDELRAFVRDGSIVVTTHLAAIYHVLDLLASQRAGERS